MLPSALFNRKASDSSIMTYCYHTSYWMFHDAMPKIVDALLTLTFITLKQPCRLNNCIQRIKYTVMTSIIAYVSMIVCIKEFYYL